ncbi:MAG: hypothetical protein ACW98X_25985 [Promethearchaeota archaeon]|jgi:hypothetical protein
MTNISYEELMTELEKYRLDHFEFTEEQEKILIEARKMKVPYPKIAELFEKKYGIRYNVSTLYNKLIAAKKK